VDDEPQLCRLEEKLLMRLGYRVTSFTDSQTALEAFQKNPEAFDLVITDCNMSHLSGLDLAQELLRLRPDLPIILAIGLGEKDQIPRAQNLGIKECLEKPILCGDLGKTIRRLLQEQKLVRCL
jgi:DNA-binding NtrC family response regulator